MRKVLAVYRPARDYGMIEIANSGLLAEREEVKKVFILFTV
jgi:hypothetical protein